MRKLLKALKKDERGVSALEYAILAGVLVVAIAAGVSTFGDKVKESLESAADNVNTAIKQSEPKP